MNQKSFFSKNTCCKQGHKESKEKKCNGVWRRICEELKRDCKRKEIWQSAEHHNQIQTNFQARNPYYDTILKFNV